MQEGVVHAKERNNHSQCCVIVLEQMLHRDVAAVSYKHE